MVKFLAEQKADLTSRLYGLADLGYEDDFTLLMAALETRQSPEMIRTLLEALLGESIERLFSRKWKQQYPLVWSAMFFFFFGGGEVVFPHILFLNIFKFLLSHVKGRWKTFKEKSLKSWNS